jgi:hypothetical protein
VCVLSSSGSQKKDKSSFSFMHANKSKRGLFLRYMHVLTYFYFHRSIIINSSLHQFGLSMLGTSKKILYVHEKRVRVGVRRLA